MFEVNQEQTKSRNRGARVRFILMLAVILGGTGFMPGPTTRADIWEVKYLLDVTPPSGPICVGRESEVTVSVIKKVKINPPIPAPGLGGEYKGGVNGKRVHAKTSDPGIASINPPEGISGPASGSLSGSVTFKISPHRAGTTTLNITAQINEHEGADNYVSLLSDDKTSIEVVDCDYLVSMTAFWVFFGGDVNIWTAGSGQATITGDPDKLAGAGGIEFQSGFSGPACSIKYDDYTVPTNITGQIDKSKQLVLQFQYEPATIQSQVNCEGIGGSGSQQVDLGNANMPPATFPAEGGTKIYDIIMPGTQGSAKMIISVEPVPRK